MLGDCQCYLLISNVSDNLRSAITHHATDILHMTRQIQAALHPKTSFSQFPSFIY